MTSGIIKSALAVLSTSGKKKEENWSERFFLFIKYISLCYFTLIIFSTVELTSPQDSGIFCQFSKELLPLLSNKKMILIQYHETN